MCQRDSKLWLVKHIKYITYCLNSWRNVTGKYVIINLLQLIHAYSSPVWCGEKYSCRFYIMHIIFWAFQKLKISYSETAETHNTKSIYVLTVWVYCVIIHSKCTRALGYIFLRPNWRFIVHHLDSGLIMWQSCCRRNIRAKPTPDRSGCRAQPIPIDLPKNRTDKHQLSQTVRSFGTYVSSSDTLTCFLDNTLQPLAESKSYRPRSMVHTLASRRVCF